MDSGIAMLLATVLGVVAFLTWIIIALAFRTVVSTNDVHIVQSTKKTTSYGKDQTAGNTYYAWPSWMPFIGVKVIRLPMSVFSISLQNYDSYDKGRVPFMVDIMAFFRVDKSDIAAQRVSSFDDMKMQLTGIVQGAARSILAKNEIEHILEERTQYATDFTVAVNTQLKEWGITTVKNIELMDIRDGKDSQVIHAIMKMKQSRIDKDSRVQVAENARIAQEAEIESKRAVSVRTQEAERDIGVKTAEKTKVIGIASEKSSQEIQKEAAVTAERVMDVVRVNETRKAGIAKEVAVVAASQDKEAMIIRADGSLIEAQRKAEGIKATGVAEGEAEKARLMAPVDTQIALAKEIGSNEGYQTYLIRIREVEKDQEVGTAQAAALEKADVKVIANTGTVTNGINKLGDLFTSSGGTHIGAMAEGLAQTPVGAQILSAIGVKKDPKSASK